uniref:Uncharacterized protein n=1 Tax=Vitis vinifera TaxID=29760 RepID=F6HN11_VITVI
MHQQALHREKKSRKFLCIRGKLSSLTFRSFSDGPRYSLCEAGPTFPKDLNVKTVGWLIGY